MFQRLVYSENVTAAVLRKIEKRYQNRLTNTVLNAHNSRHQKLQNFS
jgi:hypothetical protein